MVLSITDLLHSQDKIKIDLIFASFLFKWLNINTL